MDTQWFAALGRMLGTGCSRRRWLVGLAGALISGLAVSPPNQTAAKCRKRCGPCKRCTKAKCKPKPNGTICAGGTCRGGACQASAPPLSPSPSVPAGRGRCAGASDGVFQGFQRYAQTFLPPHAGQLTKAEVFLSRIFDEFSVDFEIRNVSASDFPGTTILGSARVENVPVTTGPDERRVEATFSPSVPIAAGQPYALVIRGSTGNYGNSVLSGNPCPDGQLFEDQIGSGTFTVVGDGSFDMRFSVTILT
jgi:hypothetical protein